VRVRYFGHACVLLETREVSILTDPVVSYHGNTDVPRFTHTDLPARIDYVLITHGHADHLMLETLLQLRQRIGTIVVPRSGGALADPSLKLLLRHAGFTQVVEIDELETLAIPGGSLTGCRSLGNMAISTSSRRWLTWSGWRASRCCWRRTPMQSSLACTITFVRRRDRSTSCSSGWNPRVRR
jgi:L-ascorbate metabolism protein UlaG (beta-lactamase superfamily)